jgi:hypothetical protein
MIDKAKLERLEQELKKYEEKLRHLEVEFAATRSGSAYGSEYLEIQCKVYNDMVMGIKQEIVSQKSESRKSGK